MARFFVGQRVRIKWSDTWPELSGQEGRVESVGAVITGGTKRGTPGVVVAPDCWGSSLSPWPVHGGLNRFCPTQEQLEPILPDGHRASDFTNVHDLLESLSKEVA